MMGQLGTKFGFLMVLFGFAGGCAQQPDTQIAFNEDHDLIEKAELLGVATKNEIKSASHKTSLTGNPLGFNQIKPETKNKLGLLALADGHEVRFSISKNNLTVYTKVENQYKPTKIIPITGHFDLSYQRKADGSKTQYLVKDKTREKQWQKRAYISIDRDTVFEVKASKATLQDLFGKTRLQGLKITLADLKKHGLFENNPKVWEALQQNKVAPLELSTKLKLNLTKKYLNFIHDDQIIFQAPVAGYYDLKQVENSFGELGADLVKNNEDRPWFQRDFVEVKIGAGEAIRYASTIKVPAQVVAKTISGQCYNGYAEAPAGLRKIMQKDLTQINAEATLCVEVSQSYLSLFVGSVAEKNFVANVSIDHVDLIQNKTNDGSETLVEIVASEENPNWQDRSHIKLAFDQVIAVTKYTGKNYLAKSDFEGEFIYSAVIVEAHSENGVGFKGLTMDNGSRLAFVFHDSEVTAVKVDDLLNQSGLPAPVLRYGAKYFDIGRPKNTLGDRTHVQGELTENLKDNREFVRVNFAANQIAGYFNDIFGVEQLLRLKNIKAKSVMVGEVEKSAEGFIQFETEEVFTPLLAAGNIGAGESVLEPVAVRVKHSFIPVGQRAYAARKYNDQDFSQFGFFRTTQLARDEHGNATDAAKSSYINRFDLGKNDTVTFYYSRNLPNKFLEMTKKSVALWNKAFKPVTGLEQTVILKNGAHLDPYDPRYNFIVWDQQPYARSPLGYGPSIKDPKTGEIITAKSYIYGDGFRSLRRVASDYYDLFVAGKSPQEFHQDQSLGLDEAASVPSSEAQMEQIKTLVDSGSSSTRLPSLIEKLGTHAGSSRSPLLDLNTQIMSAQKNLNEMVKKAAHHCVVFAEDNELAAADFIQVGVAKGKTKEQLIDEIEQLVYLNTLSHELGHNFGLRHNFKGSVDEKNFPAKYHELKENPSEQDYKDYYATSSVMDYTSVYSAIDQDLGSYDKAAVLYGYADLLETVEENAKTVAGGDYREAVASVLRQNPGVSPSAVATFVAEELNLKSYKFCTDGQVTEDVFCNRFDQGVDLTTIARNLAQSYNLNYILNGSRRGRRTFTGSSNFVLSRYILPMRQLLDEYVYQIIRSSFTEAGAGSQQDFIGALNTAIGFYSQILTAISPGSYSLDKESGLYQKVTPQQASSLGAERLVVPLGYGKHFETQYVVDGFEEKAVARGVQFDKYAVLYAMTLRGFPARKYQRASLSVNFFDLLNDFTFDTLSSIARDAFTSEIEIARSSEESPYLPANFVGDEDAEKKTIKLKPDSSLAVRQLGSVFFASNYNTNSDRSFGGYVDFRIKGWDDGGLNTQHGVVEFETFSGTETIVVAQTADKRSISFAIATEAKAVGDQLQDARKALESLEEGDASRADLEAQIRSLGSKIKGSEAQLKFFKTLDKNLNN